MPHLPGDDDFARPLKVLRKRLNGVYREDLGFSGPTRRYVLVVAMLVGLASLPTLAILTTGSSEITGDDRPGAMDVPFLPPPETGPVRPAPLPPAPGTPSPPIKTTQGYGESPLPPSSPSAVTTPSAMAGPIQPPQTGGPAPSTSPGPADAASPRPARISPRRPSGSPGSTGTSPARPGASANRPGGASPDRPGASSGSTGDSAHRAGASSRPVDASPRPSSPPARVSARRDAVEPPHVTAGAGGQPDDRPRARRGIPQDAPPHAGRDVPNTGRDVPHASRGPHPPRRSPIPQVPDLPLVPEEDALPEPVLPTDFPTVPDLPDIPDESRSPTDNDRDNSGNSDEPHKPDEPGKPVCEKATPAHERSSRWHSGRAAQRASGDPPRHDRSTVHDRRSADRSRHSRRSAVAERPYNIRPSRILEQSHTDGNLNMVRRLLTDANSEESRLSNRPYRGMHRAEHTNYPDERAASYDRSTRVGRHHADPNPDAHYINRR